MGNFSKGLQVNPHYFGNNFEIIITGHIKYIELERIPKNLQDVFKIKYRVAYNELYQLIESSDYIIIPFDTSKDFTVRYRTTKSTGSIQLCYGFIKPPIIDEKYSYVYNLNEKNSLLYKNYSYLYNAMEKAILLENKDYKMLENNLYEIAKQIYDFSFDNIKKSIYNGSFL